MVEAQRFFRYVIPGLVLLIEFLGYLLISGDIGFGQLMRQVTTTGPAVSALLASGGFGFLLGVLYYTFFVWQERIKLGPDFHRVLEKAVKESWLTLSCYSNGKDMEASELTKRGAWRVLTSYLATRMETSQTIKGAFPRMTRFADLVHGLGTTWLGSLVALLSFLFVNVCRGRGGHFSWWAFGSFVIGLLILIVHYCNYKRVIEDYENVVDAILLNEFGYHEISCSPIKLYVFQNDLRKERLKTKDK